MSMWLLLGWVENLLQLGCGLATKVRCVLVLEKVKAAVTAFLLPKIGEFLLMY